MVLFLTAAEGVKDINVLLDAADADGLVDTSGPCDWHALPMMLGGNSYILDPAMGAQQAESASSINVLASVGVNNYLTMLTFCSTGNIRSESVMTGGSRNGAVGVYVMEDPDSGDVTECEQKNTKPPKPGDMVMNLLVKFNGPNSASGILLFYGEMDGYKFAARAPVSLSR